MEANAAAKLSRDERIRMSHGYSFAAGQTSKRSTKGSHTHGGHSQAAKGFECDAPPGKTTKDLPGWCKVAMPHNHIRFCRPADEPRRSASTSW
jgi:hypothetical protein